MKTVPYLLHALSPLHAGTGQGVDVVDLPIARMRSTGIPIVPGSSMKGVSRDERRAHLDDDTWKAVYGPDTAHASDHAGALVFGDAVLLALPVRSFVGTFAWVSSPLLLRLARRDLDLAPHAPSWPAVPELTSTGALVAGTGRKECANVHNGHVILEDLDLVARTSDSVASWGRELGSLLDDDGFGRRFVVVDDESMTFLFETCTQIDARNRIDHRTGTVAKGQLWYEESLPPETVLIGRVAAEHSRRGGVTMDPNAVLNAALPANLTLQVGGKATVGRGVCRVVTAGIDRGGNDG